MPIKKKMVCKKINIKKNSEVRHKVSKGELEGPIDVYQTGFPGLWQGVIPNEERMCNTRMKLICVGKQEKVVGLHVIGPGADEMMQGFGYILFHILIYIFFFICFLCVWQSLLLLVGLSQI